MFRTDAHITFQSLQCIIYSFTAQTLASNYQCGGVGSNSLRLLLDQVSGPLQLHLLQQTPPMASAEEDNMSSVESSTATSSTAASLMAIHLGSDDDGLFLGEEQRAVLAARRIILKQKKALIELKKEKVELLNQLKDAYDDLESKEKYVSELVADYEVKTRESVEYVRQIADLAKQHEMTKAMIVDLREQKNAAMRKDRTTSMSELRLDLKECGAQTDRLLENGAMSAALCNTLSSDLSTESQVVEPDASVITDMSTSLVASQSQAPSRKYSRSSNVALSSFSRLFSLRRRSNSTLVPQSASSARPIGSANTLPAAVHIATLKRGVAAVNAEDLQALPVEQWRSEHVAAWLELRLGTARYASIAHAQIKSGVVLLQLTETDISRELRIVEPLIRRKLKLVIDDLRCSAKTGAEGKVTAAAALDINWVCERFLPWCGLPQYRGAAAEQLLDGRLLAAGLTRKELERHVGFYCKRHVSSFLHGVELMRRLDFNVETLAIRRRAAEEDDVDAFVWSNQRLAQWLADNDLHEYLTDFAESGLHGAYICLESGFDADTLATMLGVPKNNVLVRRHLTEAFERCIRPARLNAKTKLKRSSSSFGRKIRFRQSQRSYSTKPIERSVSVLASSASNYKSPSSRATGFVRSYRAAGAMPTASNSSHQLQAPKKGGAELLSSTCGGGGSKTLPIAAMDVRSSLRATVRLNPNYIGTSDATAEEPRVSNYVSTDRNGSETSMLLTTEVECSHSTTRGESFSSATHLSQDDDAVLSNEQSVNSICDDAMTVKQLSESRDTMI